MEIRRDGIFKVQCNISTRTFDPFERFMPFMQIAETFQCWSETFYYTVMQIR